MATRAPAPPSLLSCRPFSATVFIFIFFLRRTPLLPNFQIINNEADANWFQAELNGKTGFIPANYVDMSPHEYDCLDAQLLALSPVQCPFLTARPRRRRSPSPIIPHPRSASHHAASSLRSCQGSNRTVTPLASLLCYFITWPNKGGSTAASRESRLNRHCLRAQTRAHTCSARARARPAASHSRSEYTTAPGSTYNISRSSVTRLASTFFGLSSSTRSTSS